MKSFLSHGHARITFTGGTNVTLRGSTDPKWGWIDGHGQPVRERFNSLRLKSVFHWILDIAVVGCRSTNESASWDCVQEDQRRCYPGLEDLEGETRSFICVHVSES